jgi:hypothetical protein
MKSFVIVTAALLTSVVAAQAQDTTVIERRSNPGVVIEHRQSAPVVEHRSVETTGSINCKSKTVQAENDMGDKTTVHKEKCD